jgi:hypothetical protein
MSTYLIPSLLGANHKAAKGRTLREGGPRIASLSKIEATETIARQAEDHPCQKFLSCNTSSAKHSAP